MRTSCVISSYNYARFLGDAVESVLRQTLPVDEILVIDDGSIDGSAEMLRGRYRDGQIRLIEKSNAGQLSCFNRGFEESTGDVVFFLDADDLYEPRYVESVLQKYEASSDYDFVFTGVRKFGKEEGLAFTAESNRDLGYSVLSTLFHRAWLGSPTSAISMRRSLLGKVLPIPFIEDWRIRADDCLVLGASIAGGRKFQLAEPLVRYRVHGDNGFYGRQSDAYSAFQHRLAVDRLLRYLVERRGYDVDELARLAPREFATIPQPSPKQMRRYRRTYFRSTARPLEKLRGWIRMWRHYRLASS